MRSAVDFLPWYMMALMNFETVCLSYRVSGRIGRLMDFFRRLNFPLPWTFQKVSLLLTSACGCFGLLGSIFGSALVATIDAGSVERPTHDVIAHARQVLYASTTNEHDRVLLQIMTLARYIGGNLEAIGQTDTRDFAQCRVGLLGRGGVDARADAPLLRIGLERWRFFFLLNVAAALPDELIDCRH